MGKQYAVLGLGKFGYAVAVTLAQAGCQVLAVDRNAEIVQEIADQVTYAVRADVTDSRVFDSLGISNMDVVIVGISENMEASTLATIQAKEAGVPTVIAKGMNKIHANILRKVGADQVVMAESETGVRLAKNLMSGGFQDFFMLSDSFSIVEMPLPETWVNQSLQQLDLRRKYGINVVGVKSADEIRASVNPRELLREGDILILIGGNKDLAKMMKKR
ncbi:MAG: potassium channel family protein [Fusicatenibacter sp.]|nr:TrkA family potassium uptake protein [Fusicatenibacter sp.]